MCCFYPFSTLEVLFILLVLCYNLMDWVDLYSRKETDEMKQSNKSGKAEKNTNKNADHKKKKSRTVAGILALFTGAIGLHKFYLGEWKTGVYRSIQPCEDPHGGASFKHTEKHLQYCAFHILIEFQPVSNSRLRGKTHSIHRRGSKV